MPAIARQTRPTKSKRIDPGQQDELLNRLLTHGAAVPWHELRERGATDSELHQAISVAYGNVSTFIDHEIGSVYHAQTYGLPLWFGESSPPTRVPDLSGEKLLMAVRRIFAIEMPPAMNGHHKTNGAPKRSADVQSSFAGPPASTTVLTPQRVRRGGSANTQSPEPPAAAAPARAALYECELPLDKIQPSDENPREDFDKAFLAELGKSLREKQLTRLRVRTPNLDGIHEIIDGETRWRAAQLEGLATLRCEVVECTDAEAALERILSYRQRRDLNPVEEARGIKLLLDEYHLSQDELAQKIGLSQGQISNRIRLLRLPKEWQQRIISHEISSGDARTLATWHEEPEVFKALSKAWKHKEKDEPAKELITHAIHEASHELLGGAYVDGGGYRQWAIDTKDASVKAALRIRECPHEYRDEIECRAFNVSLAKKMKAEAIAKLKAKSGKKLDAAEARAKKEDLSPEEKAKRTKQLREQAERRLYSYRTGWYQRELLAVMDDPKRRPKFDRLVWWAMWFTMQGTESRREEELAKAIGTKLASGYRGPSSSQEKTLLGKLIDVAKPEQTLVEILKKWLAHDFIEWRSDLKPWVIERLAVEAGVNLATEWKLEADFLGLFTKGDLVELLDEWKLRKDFPPTLDKMTRSGIAQHIMRVGSAAKVPDRLLKAKEVSLR